MLFQNKSSRLLYIGAKKLKMIESVIVWKGYRTNSSLRAASGKSDHKSRPIHQLYLVLLLSSSQTHWHIQITSTANWQHLYVINDAHIPIWPFLLTAYGWRLAVAARDILFRPSHHSPVYSLAPGEIIFFMSIQIWFFMAHLRSPSRRHFDYFIPFA